MSVEQEDNEKKEVLSASPTEKINQVAQILCIKWDLQRFGMTQNEVATVIKCVMGLLMLALLLGAWKCFRGGGKKASHTSADASSSAASGPPQGGTSVSAVKRYRSI